MAILIGVLSAAGVLCIAAAGYRMGLRAGWAKAYRVENQWRVTALAMMKDHAATGSQAQAWQLRAEAMGRMLKGLGYTVFEIEDPATGKVDYRAMMTQPAQKLPLGPSLS